MQIFIIGYFLPLTIRTSQWPITMLLEALFVFSLHLCNDVYIQCHACSSWTLLAHIFDELQLLCFVSFEIAKTKRHENELQNLKAVKYEGFTVSQSVYMIIQQEWQHYSHATLTITLSRQTNTVHYQPDFQFTPLQTRSTNKVLSKKMSICRLIDWLSMV